MARLFGKINGFTAGRAVSGTEARRLAEDQIDVEVSASRRTFVTVQLFADGSGTFTIVRDGVTIGERWNADTNPLVLGTTKDESAPPLPEDRPVWGKRVDPQSVARPVREAADARD